MRSAISPAGRESPVSSVLLAVLKEGQLMLFQDCFMLAIVSFIVSHPLKARMAAAHKAARQVFLKFMKSSPPVENPVRPTLRKRWQENKRVLLLQGDVFYI